MSVAIPETTSSGIQNRIVCQR